MKNYFIETTYSIITYNVLLVMEPYDCFLIVALNSEIMKHKVILLYDLSVLKRRWIIFAVKYFILENS